MFLVDEYGDEYKQCQNCEDGKVYMCTILGTDETYPENVCGRCDILLCHDCASESTWTYDHHQCCTKCCDELDEEDEQ